MNPYIAKHQEEYEKKLKVYALTPVANPDISVAAIYAVDPSTVVACSLLADLKIATPYIIGPEYTIKKIAIKFNLDLSNCHIIDAADTQIALEHAIELAKDKKVDILMKGKISTSELMHAIIARENDLRTDRRVSHVFLMHHQSYKKPFIITDSAINTYPDLDVKKDIIQNAVDLFLNIYGHKPKVAILSASEVVNPALPSSIDAAALMKLAEQKEIKNCIVHGPLAFDNAFSTRAAEVKGIISDVAGDTDIFVMPNIDAGNIAYKQMSHMCHADSLGLVLGTKIPVVLTSRAEDNPVSKVLAVVLAAIERSNQS